MECKDNIIGKRDLFAIQYGVERIKKPYIWGHICYWINGVMVGDITQTTILSDVFIFLPRIIYDNGNRIHELFYTMNKDKVFYFLSGQAFIDNPKYEELATIETWARFSIEIGLDVFSGTTVKLIENERNGRIIFSNDKKEIYEFSLQKGIADNVFERFSEKINGFYENIDE